MLSEHISVDLMLFFILYGVTGVVPLIAALYLLLRRGNAFAPDVAPPLLLRRWAALFFVANALGHVLWMLFYFHSGDIHSVEDLLQTTGYVPIVLFDCLTMMTTIAGTLLAMLQDRKRPVWPVFAALVPYVILGGVIMVNPRKAILLLSFAYVLLLFALFSIYMIYSVGQYRRWLRDNYADLERKEVWQTHVVVLLFMLLFIIYTLVDVDSRTLIYFLHIFELMFFLFLLWRVETLPQLDSISSEELNIVSPPESNQAQEDAPTPTQQPIARPVNINLQEMDRLLAKHCVEAQLYLQHDLTLRQLAQAIGTNRSYLGQYFSRQGITYNTYINNLRINHFVSRYQETAATGQPIIARQLASESGFRSYSTFSLAFKQRMGQSVTAWMQVPEE